jgi:polar amino acid transport system substrate-binding protein
MGYLKHYLMNKALHLLKKYFRVSLVSLFLVTGITRADTITLVADEWCPFNCEPNSELPGYAVEIATTVMGRHGHTIKYELLAWDTAIAQSREGKYNAIIGAFQGDAPDFVFPSEPIGNISGSGLFTLTSNPWKYENIDSLKTQKLGAILAYDYGEQVGQYIKKQRLAGNVELISGHKPLRRNIQKMMVGRLTVVIDAAPVFWYTAKSLGVTDKVKFVGEVEPPEGAFIAFSPTIKESESYAAILSTGIETLRKNGELAKILHKYGLQDWK